MDEVFLDELSVSDAINNTLIKKYMSLDEHNVKNNIQQMINTHKNEHQTQTTDEHQSCTKQTLTYKPQSYSTEEPIKVKSINTDEVAELSELLRIFTSYKYQSHDHDEAYLLLLANSIIMLHKSLTTDQRLLLIFREQLKHYIVRKGMNKLITVYNQLFDDDMFKDYTASIDKLSQDDIQELYNMHKNSQRKMELMFMGRNKYQFNVGDLVGARDKEGRWWAANILNKFSYHGKDVYYIHYHNWGPEFDEFVSDMHRIRRFNPKLHHCYYSAK